MNGTLELTFDKQGNAGATRVARLHQAAPLRALFPETCRMDLPVAALTATCGGFTGGDHMTTRIEIGESAAAMAVAQAAEKLYRSKDGETRIDINLRVDAGGWLEWLPQETILFDGARMRRNNRIELAGDAALLAGEILVFGRAARGERMSRGLIHDGWSIRRDGTLVWADRFHAEDDTLAAALEHPAALEGVRAAAMLVHAGPDAGSRLPLVREVLDAEPPGLRCAATVVNGVLIARWLALDALDLRPSFAAAWTVLRNARGLAPHLPTFWSH
ncbi:MAG TPA: urease accessory protein UreD [Dongiaceae bacterium]|jgi:urease accessory protein|nr:urease accessory protein UreD [Dongiaceae bacterium]